MSGAAASPTPASDGAAGRFQILSLDGGGLRGIFAASALAQLERDFDTKIVDHFDLVAGTSTGGLIALGLAAGRTRTATTVDEQLIGGASRRVGPSDSRS